MTRATDKASLILTNAKAYTLDPDTPHAEAVAVGGGRILAVGSEAEVMGLRSSHTRLIDAGGKTLLPGIVDAHFHLLWGALRLGDIDLEGAKPFEQVAERVRAYQKANPHLERLRGTGLSYSLFPDGSRLTRQHLDALEPTRPLVITGFDYHNAWCNTPALKAAGLLHGAEVGGNAEVVMGADGLAAGELREFEAMDRAYALFPEPTEGEKRALLKKAVARANSCGITSVQNMNGDAEEFALYEALDRAGEFTLRIYMPYRITPHEPVENVTEAIALRDAYRSQRVRAGALKLFMDGVAEAFTAYMLEPYPNQPNNYGEPIFGAEHYAEICRRADQAGLQIAVHAVGDAAVRRALDGFAAARQANGPRDSRHRVEHIEMLHPDDLPRFKALGVVASMQPYHCTRPEAGHLNAWLQAIPEHRYRDCFPWQTLRDAGAYLAFGSDWPVVTMNPFVGFHAAVTRNLWAPGLPPQAQTLHNTLAGYTRAAAWVEFAEGDKGMLRPGMMADLALLSADVFALEPKGLAEVRAALTVCGGEVVYEG